ncbi:zinc-binding dehydrogenase family oxidoreductase [Sesbania bispinosa]|nr:zinc-binding dehydrogenase family oxidoreductase [Sesbania bispinosa]
MRVDLECLVEITKLCEAGKMKRHADKTFPIAQVKEAHEAKDKEALSMQNGAGT